MAKVIGAESFGVLKNISSVRAYSGDMLNYREGMEPTANSKEENVVTK